MGILVFEYKCGCMGEVYGPFRSKKYNLTSRLSQQNCEKCQEEKAKIAGLPSPRQQLLEKADNYPIKLLGNSRGEVMQAAWMAAKEFAAETDEFASDWIHLFLKKAWEAAKQLKTPRATGRET